MLSERSAPAISVVVPLFNKRPYVRRCLESISRQTFGDFEVIVVDDGSTDGSTESAAMFEDNRFRLVSQRNGGAASARNRGIRESRAGLIAFLDADDEWCPEFLSAVSNMSREFPQAGLFGTGFRRCRIGEPDRETTIKAAGDAATVLVDDYLARVHEGDFITSSSVAVRRAVFETVGVFKQGEHIGEDVELWARIALRYPFAFDIRVLAIYHSEALNRSFERWRSQPPYPPVVVSLRTWLQSENASTMLVDSVRTCIDYRLMNYAHWLLTLGRRKDLRSFLAHETFNTDRFRREATLLRIGLTLLPTRVVFALRWKPARIKAWFMTPKHSSWTGTFVLNRNVPLSSPEHSAETRPSLVLEK